MRGRRKNPIRAISEKYKLNTYIAPKCIVHPLAPYCVRETGTGECKVAHKSRSAQWDKDNRLAKLARLRERRRLQREKRERIRLAVKKRKETMSEFNWIFNQRVKAFREIIKQTSGTS